jgi:hypothetical protein
VRGVQGLEFGQDEPRVIVYVPSDGHDGDAAVGRPDGDYVGPGEDGGLELEVVR